MSKSSRLFGALLGILFCSGVHAIQPTVRAGSISLNSGIKPATNAVTKTSTAASSISTTARISALPKGTNTTHVVSGGGQSNNTASLAALEEVRRELNELKSNQQDIVQNQITRADVNEVIATADLPSNNAKLNTALTQIRSDNENLQSSVDSMQQEYTENLNTNIDNRLKIRGLLDSNNKAAFASRNEIRDIVDDRVATNGYITNQDLESKNFVRTDSDTFRNLATRADIAPATLAENIANNDTAKATLRNAGFVDTNELGDVRDRIVEGMGDFITTNELADELSHDMITAKLGDTYVKSADFTKENISDTLGDTYVKDSDLTQQALAAKLGDTYVKDADFDSKVAAKNLASQADVQALSGTVNNLQTQVEGNVETTGSLLYRIAHEAAIQTVLKGDAGASFDFKDSVDSANALPSCVATTKSNAYYNSDNGMMYICSCNNNECTYKAVPFKGEAGAAGTRGADAKSVEQTYCEANFEIVSALYSEVSTIADCADATKFSNAKYTAILGGARAYCLSLAQNSASLNLDTGIGKKLVNTFGETKMNQFKSTTNVSQKINMDGFKVSKEESSQTTTFMQACEARYNEIMAGEDGADAKSVEQTYCEANFEIVSALYSEVSTIADCADATKFSNAKYTAILGGARAYCLSLAQNSENLDLDTGIGKKLATTFSPEKMQQFKQASTVAQKLNLSGFQKSKESAQTTTFMQACEARYNEIMAGEDGADAKSVEQAYCETDNNLTAIIKPLYGNNMTCETFTNAQYNAIMGGAKAYCLSLATNAESLDASTGIGLKLEQKLGTGVVSAVKTNKVATKITVSGVQKSFVSVCEEKYNEIMAGDKGDTGAAGEDGKTFKPAFDSTTGKITWTLDTSGEAPADMKVSKTDSELNSLVDQRAATVATNKISNAAVTMNDLVNFINAGLLKVGNDAVVLNTTPSLADLNTAETSSLQKLVGAGDGDSTNNHPKIQSVSSCSNNQCTALPQKTNFCIPGIDC